MTPAEQQIAQRMQAFLERCNALYREHAAAMAEYDRLRDELWISDAGRVRQIPKEDRVSSTSASA